MNNEIPNPAEFGSPAVGIQHDTPSTSAHASLQTRLGLVSDLLRLAAIHADEDVEYVHQLRIATRQALAALDAYRELLPAKEKAWLRKRLNRIRSAAGDARDFDVLLTRLHRQSARKHQKNLIRYLQRKRTKSQKPVFRIHKRLESHGCFRKRVEKFLKSIQHQTDEPLANWVTRQVRDAADSFFASVPRDNPSNKDLHHFRVEAKRLRYLLELFDETDVQAIKSLLYPTVRKIQSSLGDLNDHVIAAKRLKRMSGEARGKRLTLLLAKLSKKEKNRAKKKRQEFKQKWVCEQLNQAKRSFELIRQDADVCARLNS